MNYLVIPTRTWLQSHQIDWKIHNKAILHHCHWWWKFGRMPRYFCSSEGFCDGPSPPGQSRKRASTENSLWAHSVSPISQGLWLQRMQMANTESGTSFVSLTKSNENPNTLVLGVRAFTGKVPLRSRFGNKLDSVSCLNCKRVSLYPTQNRITCLSNGYDPFYAQGRRTTVWIQDEHAPRSKPSLPNLKVPIETVYISDNEASHFRPIRDGLMIYKNILKFALSSFSSFIVDYVVYALSILCLSFIPTLVLRVLLSKWFGMWLAHL